MFCSHPSESIDQAPNSSFNALIVLLNSYWIWSPRTQESLVTLYKTQIPNKQILNKRKPNTILNGFKPCFKSQTTYIKLESVNRCIFLLFLKLISHLKKNEFKASHYKHHLMINPKIVAADKSNYWKPAINIYQTWMLTRT